MKRKTATQSQRKSHSSGAAPKPVKRKTAASKAAARKLPSKAKGAAKAASKKAPPKKTASRKVVAKTAPATKAPARKTAAVKAPARKTAARPAKPPKALAEKKPAPAKVLVAAEATVGASEAAPGSESSKIGRLTSGIYAGIMVCDNPGRLPKKTPYSKRELDVLSHKLYQERESIALSLAHLEQATLSARSYGGDNKTPGYSTDPTEFASDYQAADTSLGLRAMAETRGAQIEEAFGRLEEGLYGVCVACGEKIGYQRLLASPFSVLCISCRGNYEKRRVR